MNKYLGAFIKGFGSIFSSNKDVILDTAPYKNDWEKVNQDIKMAFDDFRLDFMHEALTIILKHLDRRPYFNASYICFTDAPQIVLRYINIKKNRDFSYILGEKLIIDMMAKSSKDMSDPSIPIELELNDFGKKSLNSIREIMVNNERRT